MINFEENIFEHEGFRLEVYPMLNEPEDDDFDSGEPGLAIQCGADFHLSYNGDFSDNPKLGILQFVRSKEIIGNPPRDSETGVCLDKRINDGHKLVDYLFGNTETKITYGNSRFLDKPTAVRKNNECEIYDIPREIHGIDGQKLKDSPIRIEFWDFIVRIENDYVYINPEGIQWQMVFTQIGNTNDYTCDVGVDIANFSDLNYTKIFSYEDAISETSYEILESLR